MPRTAVLDSPWHSSHRNSNAPQGPHVDSAGSGDTDANPGDKGPDHRPGILCLSLPRSPGSTATPGRRSCRDRRRASCQRGDWRICSLDPCDCVTDRSEASAEVRKTSSRTRQWNDWRSGSAGLVKMRGCARNKRATYTISLLSQGKTLKCRVLTVITSGFAQCDKLLDSVAPLFHRLSSSSPIILGCSTGRPLLLALFQRLIQSFATRVLELPYEAIRKSRRSLPV